MRSVGTWSYSIYLVHALVIMGVEWLAKYVLMLNPAEVHGVASIGFNLLILGLTVTASRFTYIHVEDKYREMVKNRLRESSRTTRPTA